MSVFEHTMMVVDRMAELCDQQDASDERRVRSLLMALAHDIGKVGLANDEGGLRSDPPTRFGGHDDRGAAMMPYIAERLGLETQYEKAMQDAAEFHMDFFDITRLNDPDCPKFDAQWALDMVENFDYDHLPSESTIHGATVMEMADLIHADHEGRLELRVDLDENQNMTDVGNVYESDDPMEPDVEDVTDDVEFEEVQPSFDKTGAVNNVLVVQRALGRTDGFSAMREGLCDDHGEVADEDLSSVLESCDGCLTPGPWIGDTIRQRRIEHIERRLEGGKDE